MFSPYKPKLETFCLISPIDFRAKLLTFFIDLTKLMTKMRSIFKTSINRCFKNFRLKNWD